MIYDLLESDEFEVDEVSKVNSEKNSVESFLKVPKQNHLATLHLLLQFFFLMIINILIITIKHFFIILSLLLKIRTDAKKVEQI